MEVLRITPLMNICKIYVLYIVINKNFIKMVAFFLTRGKIRMCKLGIGGVLVMAYKISDDCVMCGACAANCPVEAISEGDGKYEIDADVCVSCGSCASVCPVGAPNEE